MLVKATECSLGGDPDIEAPTVHGISSMLPPGDVPPPLVIQIPAGLQHAVCQSQRHRSVIGPLEPMRTAGPIAGDRHKAAWRPKLDGCTQGVTNSPSQQAASLPILNAHWPVFLKCD